MADIDAKDSVTSYLAKEMYDNWDREFLSLSRE